MAIPMTGTEVARLRRMIARFDRLSDTEKEELARLDIDGSGYRIDRKQKFPRLRRKVGWMVLDKNQDPHRWINEERANARR